VTGGARARAGRTAGWIATAALALTGCYSGLDGGDGAVGEGGADGAEGADGADGGADGADDGDGDGGDGGPAASCGEVPTVAGRDMRRLTPVQYQNTMRDLLGDPEFVAEYDDLELVPTERGVRQLRGGAESAIAGMDQWNQDLVPCDINGPEDAACPGAFIDALASKAFRRPITDAERDWLLAVYEETLEEHDFKSGMEALIGTILQAPAFIYISEVGTPVEGAPDEIRALDDYEMASRLSYFLWDSMPDDALFDAAAAGELTTQEGLQAQVERMVADPRAEAKMQAFVYHWLELDGGPSHFALGEQTKNPDLFPEYNPAFVDAMKTELDAFVHRSLFEADGNFDDLLVSRDAYVNGSLSELYGVQGGPMDDDTWAWVQLDPTRYSGVLTRAAFTSTYASPDVQSPVRRGVWVYSHLMCGVLGDPPPNANDVPVNGGEVDGEVLSVREDVELRTSGPDCSGCHDIINNIGFAFENYDAIGRWRSMELTSGRIIDSTGTVMGTDIDGPVANGIDLSDDLVGSGMVKRCFAKRWFEQAVGGPPEIEDVCSMEQIEDEFAKTGSVRDLMVAITASDAFRFVNTTKEAE